MAFSASHLAKFPAMVQGPLSDSRRGRWWTRIWLQPETAPIAQEALQRIAVLYAIEAEARGKPPDIRRAVRQERSRPLVEDLFAWLSAQITRLPGGSPTAQAIRYALNHRDGLVRFLGDGRIECRDLVHYVLPFGPLGALVHPILVAPQLRKIFNHRHTAVERIFPT
jgi:hypothetical protein